MSDESGSLQCLIWRNMMLRLAVSSSLTSGLFEHLDRLRLGGKLWVDWWTRPEIEERLQAYPDVASKFSHIVRAV